MGSYPSSNLEGCSCFDRPAAALSEPSARESRHPANDAVMTWRSRAVVDQIGRARCVDGRARPPRDRSDSHTPRARVRRTACRGNTRTGTRRGRVGAGVTGSKMPRCLLPRSRRCGESADRHGWDGNRSGAPPDRAAKLSRPLPSPWATRRWRRVAEARRRHPGCGAGVVADRRRFRLLDRRGRSNPCSELAITRGEALPKCREWRAGKTSRHIGQLRGIQR